MPVISSKRQITLPINQCKELGIHPGDEYQSFVANGHITIVRKESGAARGRLKGIKADRGITEEESRQDALG